VALNKRGQARATLTFEPGAHQIMASYSPRAALAQAVSYLPSTSPIVLHTALNAVAKAHVHITPSRRRPECPEREKRQTSRRKKLAGPRKPR
jgi:hypothetical protein